MKKVLQISIALLFSPTYGFMSLRKLVTLVCVFLTVCKPVASQTTYDWLNTAPDGNWRQGAFGARWNPGGLFDEPPSTSNTILRFNNTAQTAMTNNVSAGYIIQKIIFGSFNTSPRTIGGNAVQFFEFGATWPRIQNDAASVINTINFPFSASTNSGFNMELVANAGPLEIGGSINSNSRIIQIYGNNTAVNATDRYVKLNGVLSGAGTLNVSQFGVVKLNANHTYTGQTQIDNGELWIEAAGDISGGGGIFLGNGGQLANVAKLFLSNAAGGVSFTRTISVNNGNASTRFLGGLNTSGTNTFTAGIVISASSNLNFEQVGAGGTTEFSGVISGSGGAITKIGSGTVRLSAANTYTGLTTINAGILQLNRTGGNTLLVTNNVTVASGGTLRISTDQQLASIINSGIIIIDPGKTLTVGSITGSGTITGSPTSNLIITGAGSSLNFDQTSASTRSLNNLTLAATAGASLGSALDIYGVLGLTAGASLNMNTQAVTLKSTAASTARVADLTGSIITGAGNVTVERYLPNPQRAWHLLSAKAVTGAQTIFDSWQEGGAVVSQQGTWITAGGSLLPGFDGTSTNGSSILIHDQTVPSWTSIPVAATNTAPSLSSRQGYMVFIRGDRTCTPANATVTPTVLRAKGTLTQGPVNVTVSSTGTGRTLVGNPYASPINMEPIFAGTANLDQNMMVWDPALAGTFGVGGYRAVVRTAANAYDQTPVVLGGTTVNDPTIQFIHSGSAFFLKATGANASVLFTESVKATSPTTVYNPVVATTADQQIIANLMVVKADNTASLADGIRVRYDAAYSASQTDDIEKMGNFGENISSYRNGKKLIVEQRPLITEKDTIFLRMTNTGIKNYRFQIGTIDFVQADVKAYLEDMYKGTRKEIDLTGTINYVDFNITSDAASANQDRFRIVFAAKAQPQTTTTVKAAQQGTAIAVEWKAGNQYNMKHYEVERSTDGINYTKVNTQPAIGTNGSDVTYNWLDVNPVIGNNHYRIRSVGTSGVVKISQSVMLFMGKGNAGITVYPNPVINRNIGLLFSDMEKGIYQLRLLSKAGQVLLTRIVNHPGGSASQTVSLGYGIATGRYQLEIINPDHATTTKAIIVTE